MPPGRQLQQMKCFEVVIAPPTAVAVAHLEKSPWGLVEVQAHFDQASWWTLARL